jgi:hypothetical protein
MAISKVTAAQFIQQISKAILSRNNSYDVAMGPIPDLITNPTGYVLESLNDSILQLDSLLKFIDNGTWSYDDLVAFVANEGIIPDDGNTSTAVLTFSTAKVTQDIFVQTGFPVGTQTDESNGDSYTFVVTEDAAILYDNKSAYFNPDTQRYELQVQSQCTSIGIDTKVAANRITRPLRPLTGFDSVTNLDAASGGRDATGVNELIERYIIAISGTDNSTPDGIKRIIRDKFKNVYDSLVVCGVDTLLTRAETEAGAVDVWVVGASATTRTDVATFVGILQPIVLLRQPVTSIIKVSQGATVYTKDVDYSLISDISGYSGSISSSDSIMFLPNGTTPAIGSSISIQYIQNSLIEDIQSKYTTSDIKLPSGNLLIRAAEQVDLTLDAILTSRSGYDPDQLIDLTTNTIYEFINSMLLNARIPGITDGGSVQLSDINAKVRTLSGIENFQITIFDVVGNTGLDDIIINKNQYPRIALNDVSIVSG